MTKTIKNKKQNSSSKNKSKTKSRTKHRVSKLYGGDGPYEEEQNNDDVLYNEKPDMSEMPNNNNNSSMSHSTHVGSIAMKSPSTRINISSTKKSRQPSHLFRGKVGSTAQPVYISNPRTQNHNNSHWVTNNERNQYLLRIFKNFIKELNTKANGLTFCDGKVILYYISMYFKNILNTKQREDIKKHMMIEQIRIGIQDPFFKIVKEYIDLLKLDVKPKQNKSEKICNFVELENYLYSKTYQPIYQKLLMHTHKEYVGNAIDKNYSGRVRAMLKVLNIKFHIFKIFKI